jgi:hypothetical protein
VTGIGIAIKRIVEDAQKKGLLRAQSQFQAEGSNLVNIAKEGREATRGAEDVTTKFIGADPTEDREITHPRAQTPKTLPKEEKTLATQILELRELGDLGGEGSLGEGIVAEETAAINLLKELGLEATPGNVAEAKRQLKQQGQ